jgi:hypothetical protein
MRPRLEFWPVTCKAWTLVLGLLATGLIACGASRAQGFARNWSPGQPISVLIVEPGGNIVVPPGATVECQAYASDVDTWTESGQPGSDPDILSVSWSATGNGSFSYEAGATARSGRRRQSRGPTR